MSRLLRASRLPGLSDQSLDVTRSTFAKYESRPCPGLESSPKIPISENQVLIPHKSARIQYGIDSVTSAVSRARFCKGGDAIVRCIVFPSFDLTLQRARINS
jgi:hypothetical protein